MQFKDWEPPSNEISSEGLDMDAFTKEEIEYLKDYEKKYHKLTEEEKEEIINERRNRVSKKLWKKIIFWRITKGIAGMFITWI